MIFVHPVRRFHKKGLYAAQTKGNVPMFAMALRVASILCAAFLYASCSNPPHDPRSETDTDAAESEQEQWKEDASRAVAFVRMHPGAAQKNGYLNWQLFKNAHDGREQWRVNGRPISEEAATGLNDLLDEVARVSAPSDGIYGCRTRENMPQYRLDFKRNGHEFRVISVSDCANGAPFNVLVDGEYRIDIAGNIGARLQKALNGAGMALAVGSAPGMIMLDSPIPISGYEGKIADSPRTLYDQKIRSNPVFADFHAQMTKIFDQVPSVRIACNQAKSPDCTHIHAQYVFRRPTLKYDISLTRDDANIAYGSPLPSTEAIAALSNLITTPIFQQYVALDPAPVDLAFKPETDCNMVQGLAPHMDKARDVSCAGWQLFGGSRPAVVYYMGLDALWVPSQNSQSWISAVCQWKKLPKQAKAIACTQSALPASLNVFWHGDGTVYGFETRDGKTKILK